MKAFGRQISHQYHDSCEYCQIFSVNGENCTCSDLDENGTIVLEMVKCGANLVSDEKVEFSRKWWGLGGMICKTLKCFRYISTDLDDSWARWLHWDRGTRARTPHTSCVVATPSDHDDQDLARAHWSIAGRVLPVTGIELSLMPVLRTTETT